jgi:hypothetical protein
MDHFRLGEVLVLPATEVVGCKYVSSLQHIRTPLTLVLQGTDIPDVDEVV